jgi:hypothetical protein
MALRARDRRPQPGAPVALLLLAWAFLHVLIGRQGVYNHEWWWWPLTPGIAVASALLVDGSLDRPSTSRSLPAVATLAIALFAVWTTRNAYGELFRSHQQDPFTTMELGRAIQIAAPEPNDMAMLAWSGDDPELWFYGDRPLQTDIWTVDDFTTRRSGAYADLVFGDLQPWPAPATGLVFPAGGRSTLPGLHTYLVARYPQVPLPEDLANKFEVFDMRPDHNALAGCCAERRRGAWLGRVSEFVARDPFRVAIRVLYRETSTEGPASARSRPAAGRRLAPARP